MTNPFLPQQPAPAAPQQPNPYAPQQPQQGNPYAPQQPQGNPYAPQQPQYTQQPAQQPQYAPQQQYAAPAPAAPAGNGLVAQPGQFVRPGPPPPPGQGNMPSVSDLQGRLLIIMPERIERQVPSKFTNNDGTVKLQDKLTATVVVLDGGPLQWGGTQPNSPRQSANVPYVIKGLWIVQKGLVVQLEEALAMRLAGGPGLGLGRLWKTGNAQNDPYVLAEPQQHEVEMYNQYVSQVNPFAL